MALFRTLPRLSARRSSSCRPAGSAVLESEQPPQPPGSGRRSVDTLPRTFLHRQPGCRPGAEFIGLRASGLAADVVHLWRAPETADRASTRAARPSSPGVPNSLGWASSVFRPRRERRCRRETAADAPPRHGRPPAVVATAGRGGRDSGSSTHSRCVQSRQAAMNDQPPPSRHGPVLCPACDRLTIHRLWAPSPNAAARILGGLDRYCGGARPSAPAIVAAKGNGRQASTDSRRQGMAGAPHATGAMQ